MTTRFGIKVRKWVLLTHRWSGIIFCLLFLMWFVSGIVMMYVSYPELRPSERLAHMRALDGLSFAISPSRAAALAKTQAFQEVRASSLLDRPVYRFQAGPHQSVVFADTGEVFRGFDQTQARKVAAAWLRQPISAVHLEQKMSREDQWTVTARYRSLRPLWKFAGAAGEVVYVSDVSGEVVQHTNRISRWGSYFGAIPHWIYFTQLRKDAALWSSVVILLSGAGVAITLLGIIGGVWLYSPSRRYRFRSGPSGVPFEGQKRWHLILGYVFGLATFTWIFSGMWSMSPIKTEPETVETQVWRAARKPVTLVALPEFDKSSPQWALDRTSSVVHAHELELIRIGEAYAYLASESPTRTALQGLGGRLTQSVGIDLIRDMVNRAVTPYSVSESRIVTKYETYYVDRHHEKPLPVLYLRLNDPARCFFYFNIRSGALVGSYGPAARWDRWLYNGLHSLDLPLLYKLRPLWDAVVIGFMLGGTALSVTGCVLAGRRLNRRIIKPAFRAKSNRVS